MVCAWVYKGLSNLNGTGTQSKLLLSGSIINYTQLLTYGFSPGSNGIITKHQQPHNKRKT